MGDATAEDHMVRKEVGRVRLLQQLPGRGAIQCLRLALPYREQTAVMPGQYCLLSSHERIQPCSYVSVPGRSREFLVVTSRATPLEVDGEWLSYSGPIGSGWPVPLLGRRLLAITRGYGFLPLLCVLDEISCWLPWVEIHLLYDAASLTYLPEEYRHRLAAMKVFSRTLYPFGSQAELKNYVVTLKPDMVYCCAPSQLAFQLARRCIEQGVCAQRIWIRADHVGVSADRPVSPWDGPVHRFDRVLAARY
ncbi:2-polyprenylphenol hydroxylase-like oxidoreductase [Pseudomonas alkylphenolica]|uniref:2-polyprenylphenol hydroxylase-like oxidoreductase n=1 Tax=Pseudomonas alkylphenolica TaxID=237609 RepID=A0A077FAZ2_9PSED|nr:2-polyprenylphenol hydroxylase-like oxidoreductase [Pseudomonas alkylphenolica]